MTRSIYPVVQESCRKPSGTRQPQSAKAKVQDLGVSLKAELADQQQVAADQQSKLTELNLEA